jgi:parallel beta-helix repeat protein
MTLERSTLQAIHLNASSYWQEGYWPSNVTIRNNVIGDNTSGSNRYSCPSNEVGSRLAVPGHVRGQIENCDILGNTIINSAYSAIQLNYDRNCRIAGNAIVNPGTVGGGSHSAIVIRGGENVVAADRSSADLGR